jgi:hypothetical protein
MQANHANGGQPRPKRFGFQFQKRSQLFVGVHNKALSVAAMRVSNPDRSPLRIKG